MTQPGSGTLQIGVWHDGARIIELQPRLSRPSDRISSLLHYRDPEQAILLLGMLFSICASAHQAAGERAVIRAKGVQADPVRERYLERLVAVERVRESAMRLFLDWRYPCVDDRVLGEGVRRCNRLSQTFKQMPDGDAEALAALISWWQGVRCFNSHTQKWIADRCERFRGILLRGNDQSDDGIADAAEWLAAFLAALVARIDEGIEFLARTDQVYSQCPPDEEAADGTAIGWALTARGWLQHEVGLEDNRVTSWRIVAPTDRNFHTRGKLWQLLKGVEVGRELTESLVRDLTLAIDPCVAFEVKIQNA